jgi:hypothetical protein
MSVTVLCPGCGGRVPVPEDYTRARIRCPHCGVMSDVPAAATAKKPAAAEKPRRPAPPPEDNAAVEDALFGDDAPPAAEERPAKRKADPRLQPRPRPAKAPLHPLPPSQNEGASDDEEDGRPYRVPSLDEERPCPQCRTIIALDAVFCTKCGYNLQTGKKAKQEFEPVQREWQGGLPANVRLGLFLGAVGLYLVLAIFTMVSFDAPVFGAFFPFVLFTAMTAFLLGTYDRIRLTRNKKGRVRLTKTWTLCFLPRPPMEVDVHRYGGVVYGPYEEVSIMEWLILIMLMPGIITAMLWAYFVFIRTTYQVALTKEHGHDELVLYRGGDQAMVVDIAETLRDVAHLP